MKKIFMVRAAGEYETLEAALDAATSLADTYRKDYFIFEATKQIKFPRPMFDVVDLKAPKAA